MRTAGLLLFAVLIAALCSASARNHEASFQVLFVGNSLTYVGNTPAVFNALAAANGRPAASDMLVEGGATLSQRLGDGSIAAAFASKGYSAVVVQERGGDLMGLFGRNACTDSHTAIRAIAAMARRAGARTYLLGTYQGNPAASKALVAAESAAAAEADMPYIEISEKLRLLQTHAPAMAWHAEDGMHPGSALALLNAAAVHQALVGTPPKAVTFAVAAPIYGTTSGLTDALRRAEDPPPLADTPRHIEYPAESVATVLYALDLHTRR